MWFDMFANGPGDLGSIPSRVIPKTLLMLLDTPLLNTQRYKVRIEGKVKQSRERICKLSYTSLRGAFWSLLTMVVNLMTLEIVHQTFFFFLLSYFFILCLKGS